jgi:hypothetical protein
VESWYCGAHMTVVNFFFHECGLNLNHTNDEEATELCIAKDDWGQLKAAVSFHEYVSCDNDVVTWEVQTLEQNKMDEQFTLDVSDEKGVWG